MNRPDITCCELPAFAPDSIDALRRAFDPAMLCPLGQGWLPAPEEGFLPAVVRTGWRDNNLLVFAEMKDVDIFSNATAMNQNTWDLGDAFELFLQPVDQEPYLEFHVTPDNIRLQLRFDASQQPKVPGKKIQLAERYIWGDVMRSRVWVQPQAQTWFVYAEVPAGSVCKNAQPLLGQQWHFSFCRYDYTRDRAKPVVSSTTPHTVCNFHRRQEWGLITFAA